MAKASQKVTLTPPALPAERDALVPDPFELESDGDYTNLLVRDLDLAGNVVNDSIFDRSRFAKLALNDTRFNKCQFRDARFDTCNMANAAWKNCKLAQLQLANCKFTGFRLIDTQVANVLFESCSGKFAHLNGSVFKKVIFQNCVLPGADFSNCNFQETMFVGCDLSETLFYDAKLQGTDLTGAIMGEEQVRELAPQLAELLGIIV